MINTRRFFILLVGDDGVLLLPPIDGNHHTSLYASNFGDDDYRIILNELANQPRVPILLLADTQAQHVRYEELPALGFSDRRKLAHKRLELAFPVTDYSSCLLRKKGTTLISVEATGSFQTWVERVAALPNPQGLACSLPVESSRMMSRLLPNTKHGWAIMISLHKSGGTRQIVTNDGHIIFTRLTPPIARSSSTGFVAAAFALEIKATRDYLARFGLTPEMPLSLLALVPPDLKETLDVTPLDVRDRRILTPHEASLALRLPFAPSPVEELSEIVHALYLAHTNHIVAPLLKGDRKLDGITLLIQRIGYAFALLLLITAITHFVIGMMEPLQTYAQALSIDGDTWSVQQNLVKAQASFTPETQSLHRLRKAAERQRLFAHERPPLFRLLSAISGEIASLGTVTHLDWSNNTLTLSIQPSHNSTGPNVTVAKIKSLLPDAVVTFTTAETISLANQPLSNKPSHPPSHPPLQILTIKYGAE